MRARDEAYGVKAVNPADVAGWKVGQDAKLDDVVPRRQQGHDRNHRQALADIVDQLALPHRFTFTAKQPRCAPGNDHHNTRNDEAGWRGKPRLSHGHLSTTAIRAATTGSHEIRKRCHR